MSEQAQTELQKKYGTNWTENNFQTILSWTFIAAFHIECLEKAIKYYTIIRYNIVLGLVLSTASGTISSARFGLTGTDIDFVFNILFTSMSFTIAIFTGTIKIYQIQERLESFIRMKQDWILFSTTLASELQLPVDLRHDAYYIIIKNKNKYLDLLKLDCEVPKFIKDEVRKRLINRNQDGSLKNYIYNFDITTLSDIIIQISSNENERLDIENNVNNYYYDLKENFKNIISKSLENKFCKDLNEEDRNKILQPIYENISSNILNNINNDKNFKNMLNNLIKDKNNNYNLKNDLNNDLNNYLNNNLNNDLNNNIENNLDNINKMFNNLLEKNINEILLKLSNENIKKISNDLNENNNLNQKKEIINNEVEKDNLNNLLNESVDISPSPCDNV
jgi:hypothetical protein